jgi:hypothetical protein
VRALLCVLTSISVAGCATRGPVHVSTKQCAVDQAAARASQARTAEKAENEE